MEQKHRCSKVNTLPFYMHFNSLQQHLHRKIYRINIFAISDFIKQTTGGQGHAQVTDKQLDAAYDIQGNHAVLA